MNCCDTIPLMSRLLDGELPAETARAVRGHVEGCAACAATLDDWRLQGVVLRNFLKRNALSEDFVAKVRRQTEPPATVAPHRRWIGRRATGWLQAAAAVLAALLLGAYFLPLNDRACIAHVINPGERLEIRTQESLVWMPTTAGAVLRAGDWLRNALPSDAEIIFGQHSRLIVREGALARIQASDSNGEGQVSVMRGGIVTDVGSGARLNVQTPAGSIRASHSRFTLHVSDFDVATLRRTGGDESLSVSVVPIGSLAVDSGRVRFENGGMSQEIAAGTMGSFTGTQFVPGQAAAGDVQILLRRQYHTRPDVDGSLLSCLSTQGGALYVELKASEVRLRDVLEYTTNHAARGADQIYVSGVVRYPVGTTAERLVSEVSRELDLPIAIDKSTGPSRTAYIADGSGAAAFRPGAEFLVRRSPEGLLSFEFNAVPAGHMFKALRMEGADLPELASESESVPVSVKASGIKPAELEDFLEREIGLAVRDADKDIRVVTVGRSANASKPQAQAAPAESQEPSPRGGKASPDAGEADASDGSAAGGLGRTNGPYETVWSVLTGGRGLAVEFAARGSQLPAGGPAQASSGTARATAQRNAAQNGAQAPVHLVWPPLPVDDTASAFWLYNPASQRVRTLWNGYDSSGRLVATHELILEPRRSYTLVPSRDLPVILEGAGHWETLSDAPVLSSEQFLSSVPPGLQFASDAATLPSFWQFETERFEPGGPVRLWLANPGERATRVVVSLASGEAAVAVQQFVLAPHQGLLWSLESLLALHPEAAAALGGSQLVFQSIEAGIAAGRTGDTSAVRRPRRGEWVQ